MISKPESPTRLAFGPFTVDLVAEELCRGGVCIRLAGQPLQILSMLLGRAGEVVTREELREQIWKDGTFVDFEHGLNAAINKLRRALGDSAESPHYISTIPGRGYRFIGVVGPSLPVAAGAAARVGAEPVETSVGGVWHFASRRGVLAAIAVLGVPVSLFVAHWTLRPDKAPLPVVQFVIPPPPGAIFAPPISRQPFAISPDGTRLAFTATDSSGSRVWVRELASLELRALPGSEGAWSIFWSPDSRSILYSVKRSLKQTSLDSSFTRVFPTPAMAISGTWRTDEELLVYFGPSRSDEISTRTGLTRELPGSGLRWAQFLPGSDRFLHVVYDPARSRYRAYAGDFKTHEETGLMETDSRVQYAPPQRPNEPGYLLFIRGGSLIAQPFDAQSVRLVGQPVTVAQNVIYFGPSASACFSLSDSGMLVYQSGFPPSELRWYDRTGAMVSSTRPAPFSGTVRISPDGQRAAADVWSPESGSRDIWIFDQSGRQSRRLSYPPGIHIRPVWSPDGSRIAFGASRTSSPFLTTVRADGGGSEMTLLPSAVNEQLAGSQLQIPTDWSHDGRYVAYDTSLGEEDRQVWLVDVAGKRATPLLRDGSSEWGAAFSPDDRRIAFISDESGRPEVYVQAFEALPTPHVTGERKQISREGAWLARWRPDGHELFFLGVDAQIYAAGMEKGVVSSEPKALFAIPGKPQYGTPTDIQFDVAPGGQRFAVTTAGNVAPPDLTVVQNWQQKFRH